MRKLLLFTHCLVLAPFISVAQDYQPLKISGFNHDVIAEGTSGNAEATTSTAMDAIIPSNYVLCTQSFAKAKGQAGNYGLPDNGRISADNMVFQLGNYSSANALFLMKGEQGLLHLTNPQSFSTLSILGLGTEGQAMVAITVNFTDGTKSRVARRNYHDWFEGPNYLLMGFGRVKREDGKWTKLHFEGPPTNPRMYVHDVDIPPDKKIQSILFNNISLGENPESDRLFIFAISGVLKPVNAQDSTTIPITKPVVIVPVIEEPKKPVLHGKISDVKNKNQLNATVRFTSSGGSTELQARNGVYQFEAAQKTEYTVKITSPGYLDLTQKINLQSSWPANDELSFALQPIEVGSTVQLKSVLFRQSTAILLEESNQELDAVAEFLMANPQVYIELGGHTDNQGSKKSNLKLSDDRANEIKKYLVKKGIKADRMTVKGYGSTKPLTDNKSEDSRKLNRRVEFVITKTS